MHGKVAAVFIVLTASALLASCAGSPRASAVASVSPMHARRIVTLMPAFADETCAMGEGAYLVGVSQFSRNASCARNVPEVANFASVDTEKIIALHPDVVIAIPAQRRMTAALQRAGVRTVFMPNDTLEQIFGDIRSLGLLTGRIQDAGALIARLRRRTADLERSAQFARHPRVFVVLQAQPIWTVGPQSYISTLLQMAGARNAVTALPRAYAQYSAEALLRLQPDAIVAGSDVQLESVLNREPWRSLRAVRENHVYVVRDPNILERPGPKYNEGLSWLIKHLRPLTVSS
ncbi:MAG TPA: ABC transporter substrate-binding protein [Candidatus Baltobacteraceae bacterium]|nr:ABC transporter substrate-binding protein [Candidatus Baltobacteraceae bacterium]